MTVDSSAAVAVLLGETERDTFHTAITDADRCIMSSVSYFETALVLSTRRGTAACEEFDAWIEAGEIDVLPFTLRHARVAWRAYARYGKGNHKAGLNFGDCAAYALSIVENEPLLYKGSDFTRTDVQPANVCRRSVQHSE